MHSYDSWAGPSFKLMRTAVKDQAELLAISCAERKDLTYRSDQEMEKAFVQYVSGWLFETFGLRPAKGRLLTEQDDVTAGAHPYAVLSYDYWARRFGQDPNVIGRTFRLDNVLYEIVGVADKPFTGTEPGIVVDFFLPSVMHPWAASPGATVFRTIAQVNPRVPLGPLRAKLEAISHAFEEERVKTFHRVPKESIDRLLDERLLMEPAASGTSDFQRQYSYSLVLLGVLVGLVLLIACVNVANLMTAEAAVTVRTQSEINDAHAMREGPLARLASFFAVVSVLLSAIGIYGVLDYTIAQRRREIGIRIALGARSGTIVKDVTLRLSLTVILGALTGLAVGLASASSLQTLLYQVRATDLSMLVLPFTILFASPLIAALRPVIRAIRIDPVKMLRAE